MIIDSTITKIVENITNTDKKLRQNKNNSENKLCFSDWQTLPEMWDVISKTYSSYTAVKDPYHKPVIELTYAQLYKQMCNFAAGLQYLGIEPGERIGLFSENSSRWLIADQGTIMAGCINAVRGSQAPAEELFYILKHSESTALIVENIETLDRLKPYLTDLPVKFVVLLWNQKPVNQDEYPVLIHTFDEVISLGQKFNLKPVPVQKDDVATIIYTSGTTGEPKGAMITQSNILHQVHSLNGIIEACQKDKILSILPTWHAYERSCEYFVLSRGVCLIYTNLRNFKNDVLKHKPQFLIGVPRLWESLFEGIHQEFQKKTGAMQTLIKLFFANSQLYIKSKRIVENLDLENLNPSRPAKIMARFISALVYPTHKLADMLVYSKIRQAFGGKLKNGISGGGFLAKHLDDFYEIVNIEILVGYGLTETSPVLTVRNHVRNLRGSAGIPISNTKLRIVDPESYKPLPIGQRGLVLVKGPQIMKGYYRNSVATKQIIDPDGWFNTGDLGWITEKNDLILTGRAKDLIVLSNGEKVEPQPIEDACARSQYIKQIVLVGQDERYLGALIVPDIDSLIKWAVEQQSKSKADINENMVSACLENKNVQELFRQELSYYVKTRPNYRVHERIGSFRLISEPFTMDNGLLTQTLKIKRNIVMERYQDIIRELFKY